ncbi:P44/Msp2 family outer membrane protein [Wolbachia endosymbiont (group E) of Neria commutata]|uniref:P44/Msp2 family outer membrane protein n=1 Tax=Wolbachia endosymbiont (group E) of Neria commutata TaxID=3066149 RepID=UPI0031334FDB
MLSPKGLVEQKLQGGILVNLHYHYDLINTDITPYISAGVGSNINKDANGLKYSFSYKISSGFNLPLSSTTNVFAGYSLLKEFGGHDHGLEFGMKFNL